MRIFEGNEILGYVLVALVALCLGVLLTVFCFRLKKQRDEKNDREH